LFIRNVIGRHTDHPAKIFRRRLDSGSLPYVFPYIALLSEETAWVEAVAYTLDVYYPPVNVEGLCPDLGPFLTPQDSSFRH
jgi:hypothetical protein